MNGDWLQLSGTADRGMSGGTRGPQGVLSCNAASRVKKGRPAGGEGGGDVAVLKAAVLRGPLRSWPLLPASQQADVGQRCQGGVRAAYAGSKGVCDRARRLEEAPVRQEEHEDL